ncbi:MAG: RNA-guided pseudouridylation complex pseudouridine synthase subunit Cbf5 [Candidatus Diapherotrites archaeon]|nr:RNA-guided pseudouridylation complex pseudouridine synthase subunit Cbf5 [Candidatus Diapherotrites archaeon]
MKFPWERERVLYVKAEEEEGPWGKRPEERSVEELLKASIVNLDKPPGPTSHEVVSWVKKILNVKKAGHSGTLDPKVTGVLPVGINAGTKVLYALLNAGKEYVGVMQLHKDAPLEKVQEVAKEFVGKIYQRPPVKSSVKRRLRVREVYWLETPEKEGRYVLFRTGVQAGTYARKLCHDIGLVLGTGAHMVELRRTRVGPLKEDETLVTLQELSDAYHFWKEYGDDRLLKKYLLPVEKAVEHLPKIIIRDSAVAAIVHGANLTAPGVLAVEEGIKPGDLVALFTKKGELVALAHALRSSEEIVEMEKGEVADTFRVIMEKGIYPIMWKRGKKDAGQTS